MRDGRTGRSAGGPKDDGAVAVMSAILVIVLFLVAALAVELTDLYSRDRAVQARADIAAFAAAQDLPDACFAVGTAVSSLNDTGNAVASVAGYTTTVAAMTDGSVGNGEIQVLTQLVPLPAAGGPSSRAGRG
jgi:uncharacterized membrane protein